MNNTPVLPTFYYQHNFLHLLQRVNNLYRDLLNDAEIQFVDDFLALSQDAQCLYIRLLCRKGDVFRLDKLNYPEIHSLDFACQELLSAQFFCSVGLTDIRDFGENNLIKLFTKKELLDRYCGIAPEAQRGALNALSREQLEQRLLTQAESESWWQSLLSVGVIGVFGELEFTTLRLLYFGNLHQDFSDFVLRDLGIYRYEKYPLELNSRGFNQRCQIDQYLEYDQLLTAMPELKQQTAEQLLHWAERFQQLAATSDDALLQRRIARRCCELARQLERLAEDDAAMALYRQLPVHPARERCCRILFQRKEIAALLTECQSIAARPYHVVEYQFLQQFLPRVIRWLKQQQQFSLMAQCQALLQPAAALHERTLTLAMDDVWRQQGVEAAAISALQAEGGGRAYHLENALILSVFGLYFWPLLYAPVSGAFFHEFQAAPLDLYEPDFVCRRQSVYDQLLQQLQGFTGSHQLELCVLGTAEEKHGIHNPFVFWGLLQPENLALVGQAIRQIPLAHWQAMFAYLWADLKHHRNGLPDLLWLNDDGGYRLIEVKGPGDTLQKNQRGWLEYFSRQGIPASVLYVRAAD